MRKIAGTQATWSLTLDCDCPKCEEFVDVAVEDDFWNKIQPGEHDTERSDNLEVQCPKCGHEFNVECIY